MVQLFRRFCLSKLGISILTIFIGFTQFAQARLPNFQTTRLQSTGGAGAGSILMDESTILNPAPLAFFNVSSFYFQKTGVDIEPDKKNSPYANVSSDQMAFIGSDSSGKGSGSLSYTKTAHGFDHRKRFGISGAYPIGKKSSMGMTYRITKDELSNNGNNYSVDKYNQVVAGFTHAISPEFTMGMVFIDPFKVKPEDTLGIVGMQYVYKDFISLMFDGGADYNNNLSDTTLYRAALQLKVLSDFYLRFGTFRDKGKSERGTGAGVGWVQPKLVLNLALKNSKIDNIPEKKINGEKVKETSLSLSYRF